MRLIDADALIEEIARIPDLRTLSTKTIGKAINKMATIDPQPHWIPCSERLPDECGNYLVTKETIGWNMLSYRTIDIAYFENVWHKADKVLAWMPLPEPWEGADE